MQIRLIDTLIKRDIQQFIEFPFKLYSKNAHWVPMLVSDMKLMLNKQKHPFYKHSEADFYVVEDRGETLGRIGVLHNRNYCEFHKEATAFFYFFESVDNREVSCTLFQAAMGWAKQRKLERIIGPKGFLRSSGMGILIDGFDTLPAMGIPYNFPYYAALIEDFGFEKKLDQFSGYMLGSESVGDRVHKAAEIARKRGGFQIKTFKNKKEMRHWIPQIQKVQHEAFVGNPNYFPSTDEEFEMIANSMMAIARPEMIKLILKGEDVAGFILSYPNIGKALQKTRGRMLPFGWISLLLAKHTSRIIDFNGIGLLPQYQGLGANAMLYAEVEHTARAMGIERGEFVQVNEDNYNSKSDWQSGGVNMNKLHRTYQLKLNP
jgi:N-acetylglutamate synthase-like GNAT family acetyltransferase